MSWPSSRMRLTFVRESAFRIRVARMVVAWCADGSAHRASVIHAVEPGFLRVYLSWDAPKAS